MIRYTDAQIIINVKNVDLTSAEQIRVTIAPIQDNLFDFDIDSPDNNTEYINIDKDNIDISYNNETLNTLLVVKLSQVESGKLKDMPRAKIQINWVLDNSRYATRCKTINIFENLVNYEWGVSTD